MPAICRNCGQETVHYFMKFANGNSYIECKVCEYPRHSMNGCTNPYADMVIEHVITEEGKPLRVTSRRQLEEAEKKYHFRSLVAHTWSENFDKPPQDQLSRESAPDRIMRQMREVTHSGATDPNGNKKGWMYPEVAESMLREAKQKGIDISTW